MEQYYHSVQLLAEQCIGCTDCIKRCPTDAIRVRAGKATIINERCIDCGMCINVCRNHAKTAVTQPLTELERYKYRIALPAPTLYGQFKQPPNVNYVLSALKDIGFNDVFEVARAAESLTEATRALLRRDDIKKPLISSACPVIIRLISIRFPSLIDNILPLVSPMEAAAASARRYAESRGVPREDIGVFFISPCASKATYINNPLGVAKSEVDGVISIRDIYLPLLNAISAISKPEALAQSTPRGMDWALTGGESRNVGIENAIAVDGMDNVIDVLEQVENGRISDVEFIETLACMGGCVGGALTVLNGYVAKNRLKRIARATCDLPESERRDLPETSDGFPLEFTENIRASQVMRLDEDMETAIRKLEEIDRICDTLPMIDCGACGSPSCRALAGDIVEGGANIEDCVFMLRERVRDMAGIMVDLSSKLPQTLSGDGKTRRRELL